MKLGLPNKKQCTYIGDSFADLMHQSLSDCMLSPEFESAPRGQKIKEITDVQLFLSDPTNNLFVNKARGVNLNYLAGELLWYFSGNNELEFIDKYSKFWGHIANGDGSVNSAYGNLIFNDSKNGYTGWQWVVKSLQRDKDSRQAILHFNRPEHRQDGTKDFPCTMTAQFMIRDDMLNMYCTMRSNDFTFGLTFDLPFFTLLQQQLVTTLQTVYPGLKLGGYYHNAKSLHIYEKDFELVEKMLDNMFIMKQMPTLDWPLIDHDGNPTFELMKVIEGQYSGYDKLLNWLQEHAKR